MKKKNTSVDSVEIIHDINNGKLVKKKVKVKVGSIFPLPFSKEIMTARASILNQDGALKSIEHLADIMKEDNVGDMSKRAINSLGAVISTKKRLDKLQLHKSIYEMIPEIDGMTIGFDASYTGFKILENQDGDLNNLEEIERLMEEIMEDITPPNPELAQKTGDNLERLKGLDIPVKEKVDLADKLARCQTIIEKVDNQIKNGRSPKVTESERKLMDEMEGSFDDIMKSVIGEGGVA